MFLLHLLRFLYSCSFLFFFKQKTAYELRISDWSSDVCSSDLLVVQDGGILAEQAPGLEKRRPVKELHHLRQVVVLECATPYELGTRRHIIGPIYLGTVGARLHQADQRRRLAVGLPCAPHPVLFGTPGQIPNALLHQPIS